LVGQIDGTFALENRIAGLLSSGRLDEIRSPDSYEGLIEMQSDLRATGAENEVLSPGIIFVRRIFSNIEAVRVTWAARALLTHPCL